MHLIEEPGPAKLKGWLTELWSKLVMNSVSYDKALGYYKRMWWGELESFLTIYLYLEVAAGPTLGGVSASLHSKWLAQFRMCLFLLALLLWLCNCSLYCETSEVAHSSIVSRQGHSVLLRWLQKAGRGPSLPDWSMPVSRPCATS